MQSVRIDWIKLSSYGCTAVAFWALSLIPTMPKPLQGLCSGGAVLAAALGVNESRKAHESWRWGYAQHVIDEQLQQNEIAYAAAAMDQLLAQQYESTWAPPQDPPEPEITPSYTRNSELQDRNSLESLYEKSPSDLQSPSYELPTPSFYRSITALLETQGEAYVIKDVLKMGGRNYQQGKDRLQWILETGKQMGWG